ncbi:MAG: gliding motility-associated C-terminal domain-containing protein, partial [Bacteroidota bacterium]
VSDNSTDPNGYMMVVNASFSTGVFYEQEIDGLCENTLYVFSADIINLIANGVAGHIAPNVSFLLNDMTEYTTGPIDQNNQWNTFGFTFETEPGQTTVKLTLRNNAPGGIGNDLALDNISFRACGPEAFILPETIANICEDGDPITLDATIVGSQFPNAAIQWQQSFDEGLTWVNIPGETGPSYVHNQLASGFYYYRYLLANGVDNLDNLKCRVNSNVKIVYVVPKFYEIIDTICQGLTLEVGNDVFTESGVYVDSLTSSIGCDSIVTIDLTVVPDTGIEATLVGTPPACLESSDGTIAIPSIENGYPPYMVGLEGGRVFSETLYTDFAPGTYPVTITDRFGCTFTESVVLDVPDPFIIDLGPNREIDLGETLLIEPNLSVPIADFNWTPDIGVNCEIDCLDLEWAPPFSSTYVLEAVSEQGCVAVDSIQIIVNTVRKVYIPNAFSPNGDGFNERFTVFGATPNIQLIESLQVFNRWGSLVFEASPIAPNDLSAGWDGTYKGKSLGADVFVYVAKIRYLDGVVETKTGDILLLK